MSWGAAAGAAVGGILGGFGSSSAAKKQQRATENATALQRKQTDRAIDMQQPFYEGGVQAQNKLMQLMGLDPGYDQQVYENEYKRLRKEASDNNVAVYGVSYDNMPGWGDAELAAVEQRLKDRAMQYARQNYTPAERGDDFGFLTRRFSDQDFQADPGYQFRMAEGMRGVEGSAAARGGLLSGAALKAIQKYGQNFASNEYGNAYNRFNADQTNQFNRLTGMIQSGQGSAQQIGNAAMNFGQQAGNNMIQGGNAQASGIMGTTNALVGGINQGINSWQQNQLMNLIRQPAASGWGGGGWGSGNAYGNQDLGQNL